MTYLESYPNSITEGSGLISILSNMQSTPWKDLPLDEIKSIEQAYGIRSGFKTLIEVYESAPEESRAKILLAIYASKWKKLWDDFSLEYNPLHAYIVNEEITREKDVSSENTTSFGKVNTTESGDNGTVTNVESNSSSVNNGIYGFNTIGESVPSDDTTGTENNNNTETRNLTNNSTSTNSGSDVYDSIENEEETTKTTRSGNIGYTTPQELIRQDVELWHTPYFNIVFDDIDGFIMKQVYSI